MTPSIPDESDHSLDINKQQSLELQELESNSEHTNITVQASLNFPPELLEQYKSHISEKNGIDAQSFSLEKRRFWIEIALVALGIATVVFTYFQWNSMKRTLEEMKAQTPGIINAGQAAKDSVDLTQKSMNANDSSTRETIAALRAQVDALHKTSIAAKASAEVSKAALTSIQRARVHHGGMHVNKLVNVEKTTVVGMEFSSRWINGGTTPTKFAHQYTNYSFYPSKEVPPEFYLKDLGTLQTTQFVGAPNMPIGGAIFTLHPQVLQGVKNKSLRLFFWGWTIYFDIFDDSPLHLTKFCIELNDITTEDLTTTNPIQRLTFLNCLANNCADEECPDYELFTRHYRNITKKLE